MSNGILYDPLLIEHLARELDGRLRGRPCGVAPVYSADLAVTLTLGGGRALRCDLHPRRGWIRLVGDESGGETPALIAGIEAPSDERTLTLLLDVDDRFRSRRRALTLELHTNQWNAVLHEEGRIISVLRGRRAGDRSLWPGDVYVSPPPHPRLAAEDMSRDEALDRWRRHILAADPERRRAALLQEFAFASNINAEWILTPLGQVADGIGSEAALGSFERWWSLRGRAAEPCVLSLARGKQPYPFPLEGIPADLVPSLLEAMATAAEAGSEQDGDPRLAAARAVVDRSRAAALRRLDRLRAQLEGAGLADRSQAKGDLLLANLHRVEKGAATVHLEDWGGEPIEIPLDPSLTPAENASALYDEARRRRRAEAQLPELISRAEGELRRWTEASDSIDRGLVPGWVDRLSQERKGGSSARSAARGSPTSGASSSYRTFRTSGGLEVRVGRSSRDNDRLTFRESSPNDVWLHARSVPGSHVILRWSQPDASPPAKDLGEAAQLAAVFSRARTSSTVAVDWTRRKHVRKPRGAAAGLVIPQRVKTLFVEPDPAVVERLTPEGGSEDDGRG